MWALCTWPRVAWASALLLLTALPVYLVDAMPLHGVALLWAALWGGVWWWLRSYRKHLAVYLLLLPLLGVCGEVLFRLNVFGWDGLSFDQYRPAGYGSPWATFSFRPDTYTGLAPNQELFFKGARFTVNHRGFRGKDIAPQKPAGVYRLVAVGASGPLGAGVSDEDVVFARLEARLNEAFPDRTIEIVNLSMGGASMGNMVHALRHVGMAYNPDLILFFVDKAGIRSGAFVEERLHVRAVTESRWRQVVDPQFRFLEQRFFFFQAVKQHADDLRRKFARTWVPAHFAAPRERAPLHQRRPYLDAALDRVQELAGNIPVVLYLLREHRDGEFGDEGESFERYINIQGEQRGIHVLPVPDLEDLPLGRHELILYPGDSHPNARGHQHYAETYYDDLRKLLGRQPMDRQPPTDAADHN